MTARLEAREVYGLEADLLPGARSAVLFRHGGAISVSFDELSELRRFVKRLEANVEADRKARARAEGGDG